MKLLDVSPELEIIDVQINIIRDASRLRPISLEEVRIFEILVKCKKLLSEEDEKALDAEFKKLKTMREIPAEKLMQVLAFKKQEAKPSETPKKESDNTKRKKSD